MEACSCKQPDVKSMTQRTADEYPDQYCGKCGRWMQRTLDAAEERRLAKERTKNA